MAHIQSLCFELQLLRLECELFKDFVPLTLVIVLFSDCNKFWFVADV